ncbi:MAG: long-chain-fatty-acid--CoA ligase [Gammaproteobacteria bacterium]|nr:long-chain-fatty-acid--CoA ligase [Gammaproteobacteria bacterium]NNM12742.1 long-chain-fatty-acid--CoA ligase [Gammaproteobacteria bacterium]
MKGLMQDWSLTVNRVIDHAAREHGERELVTRSVEGPIRRTTLKDIYSRSKKVAKALVAEGVNKGDRIATMAWNTDRHLEAWYGINGCGAVYHTLNPRLFAEQLIYIMNHAEDKILFVDISFVPIIAAVHDKLETLEKIIVLTDKEHLPESPLDLVAFEDWIANVDDDFDWVEVDENDASGLCYTSGTTGNPKGVMYSHRSNIIHAFTVNQGDVLGTKSTDAVLPVVPMFHANAWALAFACPMVGAKMVMPGPKMDGESIYELLESEKVSTTAAVPSVWLMLLNYLESTGKKLPYLKRVLVGGSAAPRYMIEKFEKDYEVEFIHGWGMTEMSPLGTVCKFKSGMQDFSADEAIDQKLKQGRVPFSIEMKIVDDAGNDLPRDGKAFGKLMVKGPAVAKQYYRLEQSILDEDGWMDTGDVATIDPLGFMQITDRAKDVIKSGGEWISSIDVENIAVGHPDVAEAAVIGMPHPKWDERPLLIVVPNAGATLSKESMMQFLDGKMAKWWMPNDMVVVKEIPHGATGKISKKDLRVQFADYQFPEGA